MAERGKAVRVYSLTPMGKEMAGKAAGFVRSVRNDVLEDVRVALISYIETYQPTDEIESGIRAAIRVVAHMKEKLQSCPSCGTTDPRPHQCRGS